MTDLWSRLPRVRRARGYRLYDEAGTPYLDLWQAGGHALLGHRAFRLTTVLKDTISRGNLFDLPSVHGPRLEKALHRRFPGFAHVRIEAGLERALVAVSRHLGSEVRVESVCDPVRAGRPAGAVCLWRPFAPPGMQADAAAEVRVLIPLLPFCMAGAPVALLFREPPTGELPLARPLSPVVLAGALRGLHDLGRYRPAPWFQEDLLRDSPGWVQRGIYFLPGFPPERYEAVFEGFLRERVLLPPQFGMPGILPAEASPGELKRMRELFKAFPGG